MDNWHAVLDVNLTSAFLCAREAARKMGDQGGSIVAIASIMGHVGGNVFPNPAYHASKGGVINLVRALAVEWAPKGIRVNAVAPTFVETPSITPVFEQPEVVEAIVNQTPLRRMATVVDVAAAVLFLASPASSMVTGSSLAVDGGWLAKWGRASREPLAAIRQLPNRHHHRQAYAGAVMVGAAVLLRTNSAVS